MLIKQHYPLLASMMAFFANQQNGSLISSGDCDTSSTPMNLYAVGASYVNQFSIKRVI